ncbi:MAG: ABC transporter substrate-binding protein [Pseudomonadales bacterium]|nr:ABC transporter substrate-binding protein [Pseudomonadales bacterium]
MKLERLAYRRALTFCIGVIWAQFLYAQDEQVIVVTGNFPPYSFLEEGSAKGLFVDLFQTVIYPDLKDATISFIPWGRLDMLGAAPTIMFPLAKTEERSPKYKWIGPIVTDQWVVIVRENANYDYSNPELFEQQIIGVTRGTPAEVRSHALGFKRVEDVHSEYQNLLKLLQGRIDGWLGSRLLLNGLLRQQGIEPNRVKIAMSDVEVGVYIATSLNFSDALIHKWQTEFDSFKQKPDYINLLHRYDIDL